MCAFFFAGTALAGEKTGVDVGARDRRLLELRPLRDHERSGCRREQGEDDRRRQDPGHAGRFYAAS